jgi:DNA-binding response OmpR family regulator
MLRILFANSDQKLSQIYVQHMNSHFLVDSAYDGLSALRKFKLSKPAMIVSDYHLPLLSGLSFLRFVRQTAPPSATPFIFLSSHDNNTEALNLGANDWLDIRSCQPDYLLNRIYYHLKTNKYGLQIHRA